VFDRGKYGLPHSTADYQPEIGPMATLPANNAQLSAFMRMPAIANAATPQAGVGNGG
jgi:hypothetical protein